MRSTVLLLLALLIQFPLYAQDTLRVMVYNLLFYGQNNTFCNRDCKDAQLRQILAEERLDLFAVNEISNAGSQSGVHSNALLANVLNQGGTSRWERAPLVTGTNHPILNALYYNSDKLGHLRFETADRNFPRLDLHKLYYKSADLATTGDTIFLYVGVFHQKAGDTQSDRQQRGRDMQTFIDLMNRWGRIDNLMLMGDFNCTSSEDLGYAPLLVWNNSEGQLRDPINRPGQWNDNPGFADIHTQSTRTINEADQGIAGGMDDRLDHILCSVSIMEKRRKLQYIPNTYRAVGQDGTFFNRSVLEGGHPLRNALYRMSDHLPVALHLAVDARPGVGRRGIAGELPARLWPNPVSGEAVQVETQGATGAVGWRVIDLLGRELASGEFSGLLGRVPVGPLEPGAYALELTDGAGRRGFLRFVRQ